GNPWPTIILEVVSFETFEHIKDKIKNFWLGPNRCEDVIVLDWAIGITNSAIKIDNLCVCLKFCRRTTLQLNKNATTFDPIQEIEFGTDDANGKASSSQISAPGIAIDLYEANFDAMIKIDS
ncbi:12495_t:CDS:2, partial [Dentiscutata heterogama]